MPIIGQAAHHSRARLHCGFSGNCWDNLGVVLPCLSAHCHEVKSFMYTASEPHSGGAIRRHPGVDALHAIAHIHNRGGDESTEPGHYRRSLGIAGCLLSTGAGATGASG